VRLIELGEMQISVRRKDNQIMDVDICAENRSESIHMETIKDESIDQFIARLKSMLRSLFNGEGRKIEGPAKTEVKKALTFDEQKNAIKMVIK